MPLAVVVPLAVMTAMGNRSGMTRRGLGCLPERQRHLQSRAWERVQNLRRIETKSYE